MNSPDRQNGTSELHLALETSSSRSSEEGLCDTLRTLPGVCAVHLVPQGVAVQFRVDEVTPEVILGAVRSGGFHATLLEAQRLDVGIEKKPSRV